MGARSAAARVCYDFFMPRSGQVVLLRRLLSSIALVLLGAGFAKAGVSGSPHDIVNGVGVSDYGICTPCHIPHSAPEAPKIPWPIHDGRRREICGFCHDPSGGLLSVARTSYPFPSLNPKSHSVATLWDLDIISESDPSQPSGRRLRILLCISCHNPHDNTHQPFLWRPFNVLCQSCHPGQPSSSLQEVSSPITPRTPGPKPPSPPCGEKCSECHRAHPHD